MDYEPLQAYEDRADLYPQGRTFYLEDAEALDQAGAIARTFPEATVTVTISVPAESLTKFERFCRAALITVGT